VRVVDRIDLTQQPKGCAEHPLIRLKNVVEKLNADEAVEVVTDNSVIPVETIKAIARRKNLEVRVIEQSDPIYKLLLVREK